ADVLDRLSPRERQVLGLMAEGRSNASIAGVLVITESSVEKHVSSVFTKLGLPPEESGNRRVMAVLTYLGHPTSTGPGQPAPTTPSTRSAPTKGTDMTPRPQTDFQTDPQHTDHRQRPHRRTTLVVGGILAAALVGSATFSAVGAINTVSGTKAAAAAGMPTSLVVKADDASVRIVRGTVDRPTFDYRAPWPAGASAFTQTEQGGTLTADFRPGVGWPLR
ncbi:response regulator transcription factor, partial [Massilia sp. UBA6681]|uniref:response regulator transcription factor n=1 Tax=Massilia sp. UBA6681 TaxID=1946839 RepID=UPI0025C45F50